MPRIATLFALALLAGCASAAQDPAPQADPPASPASDASSPMTLQLDVGASQTLADGSRLTYVQLVNDSRCAPDVQCVWAGDAEILLRWQPKTGAASDAALHTSTLQGRRNDAVFGTHHVQLVDLARGAAPKATLRVATD